MFTLKHLSGRSLLPGLALVAAIFAVYAYSLRGDFLWDDDLHITANPTIVGPLGLTEIWTSARALYFPLTLTNFWVQHALWGVEPLGYRMVTLAFHLGSAVLLWRVLLSLRVPGAWLGAALWALHPIHVESVAWICELKNTQSAFFFLAAILVWVRWLDRSQASPPGGAAAAPEQKRTKGKSGKSALAAGGSRQGLHSAGAAYAATLAFAVMAILSKPSTVMLPVILGLCLWWRRGRITVRDAVRLVPFFALSALAAGWTIWEQKFNSGAIGEAWDQTLPERFAIAGRVIWFYLGKLLWPDPLIFIYPRWEMEGTELLSYAWIAAAALVAGVLWWGKDGRLRPLFFSGVYFVVMLFPVLGFFSVYFFRYSFVGDHFQYLASMGPVALAGAALSRLPARLTLVVGLVLAGALGAMTARHSKAFLNNEALWRDTVAKNPAATMAWFNLGDVLARAGRHEEAIEATRRGLALKPDDPFALNDLGNELVIVRRAAEAVPLFERAIEQMPAFAEARSNFGNALMDLGRFDEAIAQLQQAVSLNPNYAEAHNNLGVALAKSGRNEESVAAFERSLALRPDDGATHDNLAGALRALGRLEEAFGHHERALRLKPDSPEALANHGRTLQAAGQPVAALAQIERALALKPDLVSARTQYAYALAETGRTDEALAQLLRAVELEPGSAEARFNYGSALAEAGRLEEAVAAFQEAVSRAPEFAPAHENLGTALGTLQRWPEAIASFEAAVRLRPDSLQARSQLAVSLVNAGRVAEAVPHFEAALALDPNSASLHQAFAQVLRALGRTREALFHLNEATRLQLGR